MVQFVIDKKRLRTHRKSRGGCLSCKERRTKCSETRPRCDGCARRGSDCIYPNRQMAKHRSTNELGPPIPHNSLNSTDLRLLHHFLLYARPYLPFDRFDKWVPNIPYQAQQFPHLMHAILALSATHLGTYDTTIAPSVGLSHRQRALEGLSATVSTANGVSEAELKSLLYTSFALMFQASYMPDGFADYFSTLRGTGTLAMVVLQRRGELKVEQSVEDGIRNSPEVCSQFKHVTVDARIPETAVQSYGNLHHICPPKGPLRKFYQMQLDIARALQHSSWEGYIQLGKLYNMLALASAKVFAQLMSPDDHVAKVLQVHLLALNIIFTPIRLYELGDRAQWSPMEAIVPWIEGICESLPDNLASYFAWPAQISTAVKEFGKTNRILASNVATLVVEHPELFI